ncbi:unnamed protein product [Amaranthus hypochondriacus]
MPSKFKKAIAAMKDQTSISIAKVSGGAESSSLEVAILKATIHDETPIDERYVTEVLKIVSSNRSYAGSCARAIGRRIGRTRSWVVAIKSLMLVLRVFQDGDPHFPKEVLHAMKRGYKILNLNSFRDDSSKSCPWDFTAFVRTFALYLEERLECFVTGKLQRRTAYNQSDDRRGHSRKNEPIVRDMKPSVLLDRILHWQKLLDRAIATQPTGAARTNQLVQTCLYAIVQETFDLYRDISDGLALLLDSFFHLQYKNCVSAFQTSVKASKQFEELSSFYDLCKNVGVGRTSEYPSVQKISNELVETLQEFLKDKSSFPGTNGRSPPGGSSAGLPPLSPNSESGSVRRSEYGGSQGTSLEDLIGADGGFSPERYSDPGRQKPMQLEDQYYSTNDTASVQSDPTDHLRFSSVTDLLSIDDPYPSTEFNGGITREENSFELTDDQALSSASGQGWELVLFETAPADQPPAQTPNHVKNDSEIDLFGDFNRLSTSSLSPLPNEQNYNPFLQDTNDLSEGCFPPTFHTEFGNAEEFSMDHFSDSFGNRLSITSTSSVPPAFAPDPNDSNNHQVDFFSDLVPGPMPYGSDLVEHNRSVSTSFLDDFNGSGQRLPTFSNANVPTTHHARFASTDLSAPLAFLGAFNNNSNDLGSSEQTTARHARFASGDPSTLPPFSGAFNTSEQTTARHARFATGDLGAPSAISGAFNSSTNNVSASERPTAQHFRFPSGNLSAPSAFSGAFTSTNNIGAGEQSAVKHVRFASSDLSTLPAFSGSSNNITDNVGISKRPTTHHVRYGSNRLVPPTYSADLRDEPTEANTMNAIVPFGQVGNDNFFSSSPKFQAAPTFRASSVEMDQNQHSLWEQNDPFGSFPSTTMNNNSDQQRNNGHLDQQNLWQQQQSWLQNQNRILARHLT